MTRRRQTKKHRSVGDFTRNLVNVRRRRQLTQLQLARLLRVQPRLISRWETGETKPRFDHMIRLAEVLDVSLDELAKGSSPAAKPTVPSIRNRRLEELCRRVDGLSRKDQEVVCHIMDSLVNKEHQSLIDGEHAR